ncbi:hypothetical protein NEL96_05855, partial [Escherichia coli]|nr:hypothetical protein [Escherichia coli]MDI1079489.1 hypothetical protein [Escherichia coli]
MSIRTEHGFGPSTVEVDWLDDCPKCQHGKAKVTGWSVTKDSLWAGDEVVCSKCGCSGQQKLATALEFFQYRFSDSFGGNPPLYSCGL